MKPQIPRQRSRRAAMSRGRMYLKDRLGWLPGFPVCQEEGAVEWLGMVPHGQPTPERFRLQRKHLHRATWAWSKLVHQFSKVLPYLVEDEERWREGIPQVLAWLKGAIHHDELLPLSLLTVEGAFSRQVRGQAAQLKRHHPAFAPLLNALSWLMYLTPKRLSAALSWFEANAVALEVLLEVEEGVDGIVTALRLWQVAHNAGQRRIAPLLLMLDRRAFEVTTVEATVYVERWAGILRTYAKGKRVKSLPQCSGATFGQELLNFIAWLPTQKRTIRRHALELFALLYPPKLLMWWQAWWDRVNLLVKRARRLTSIPHTTPREQEAQKLAKKLGRLQQQHPPYPHAKQLLCNVRHASALDRLPAGFYEQLIALLKRLPQVQDGVLVRAAFLEHWLQMIKDAEHPHLVVPLLTEFNLFLTRYQHSSELLTPWQEVVKAWRHCNRRNPWTLTDMLLDEINLRPLWGKIFACLAQCGLACDRQLSSDDGERLITLVQITNEAEQATAYFLELVQEELREAHFSDEVLRSAHHLKPKKGEFTTLVKVLKRAEEEDERIGELVVMVANVLEQAGWHGLVGELLLDGEVKILRAVGQRLVVQRALQGQATGSLVPTRPSSQEVPPWGRRYGNEFTPQLAILAAMTPDAERIAARVLDKFFPNPTNLQQEIAAIELRLAKEAAHEGLSKRLHNLHARLASPIPVSPSRLARLEEKLARATRRALLYRWQEGLDDELRVTLPKLLDVQQAPAWLFEARQLHLLEALLQLPTPSRKLGLRLLHLRCGAPPWHLLHEPANQAFLKRLRQQGINPDPWLNPPQPRLWKGKNGRQVRLVFEKDPLELFQMGEHFKTCLSIGEMNFFSVFANAADINKQVVYARNEHDQVVGRCLLALSQEGGLLTFEPYCHDQSLGFDQMMGELATELAKQMGTAVILRGKVPTLVASEWYDDGPRDLCERFAFLRSDSEFRSSLNEIESNTFLATLQENFAPLPIAALTLTLVLELSELSERPELILPLLAHIEACKGLSDSTCLRAARIAQQAGAKAFTRRILRQQAIPYLLSLYRREQWLDINIMTLLAELEPSLALRLLRQTRPRGVRRDEEERQNHRRTLLAQAHRALGRPIRAQRLMESGD